MAVKGESVGMAKARIFAILLVLAMTVTAMVPMASSVDVAKADCALPAMAGTMPAAAAESIVGAVPTAAPEPNESNTIVVQPNASVGKDAWLYDNNPNVNYGDYNIFSVGTSGTGETGRGIMQFSFPTSNRNILSATLQLYSLVNNRVPYGVNISVNPVIGAWTEGPGGGNNNVTWNSRLTGTAWTKPGGDYDATRVAYVNVSEVNTWYSWNVTALVKAWAAATLPNNGLLLNGTALNCAWNWIDFASSDNGNDLFNPKLIIVYAAEISTPVPSQTMSEDAAALTIPLNGRGSGTVMHQYGTGTGGNLLPFFGSSYNQMHLQSIFTHDMVGAEGIITEIAFNRTNAADTGTFNDFRISMAHTDLTAVTTTYADNYDGYLVEVFPMQTIFVNSSNGNSWIYFDLNGNFTYDSRHNLVVDITWNTDSGDDIPLQREIVTGGRCYDGIGGATGTIEDRLTVTRFSVDVADNVAVESGNDWNYWPFTDEVDGVWSMRMQMLYYRSMVNKSGCLDTISFQGEEGIADWCVLENVSIRLGHTTRTDLTNTFNNNIVGAWTTVFTKASYNFTCPGAPGYRWVVIDIDDTFVYNNVDNLIIDIRWRGSEYSGIGVNDGLTLTANWSCPYDSRLCDSDIDATMAFPDSTLYNARFGFADSANLTWSAVSQNPTLFTANVPAGTRNLVITPLPNQNGAGVARLTLRNSNGLTTFQDIPVTITAVNDAPVLTPLVGIKCVEDVPYVLCLYKNSTITNISDVDNAIANLTVTEDSNNAVVNGTNITFLYTELASSQNVTITVTDPDGLSANRTVFVNLTKVNDAPYFLSFPSTANCDATRPTHITLAPGDEETPQGQLSIQTYSPYASVSGNTVVLTYPKGIGSDQLTVYLLDTLKYGTVNNVSHLLHVSIVDHPEVTNHTPTGNSVPVTAIVTATFDMAMNRTKAQNAFSLKLDATAVNGTFSWSADNKTMTFVPAAHLTNGLYTVEVAASAESAAGAKMLSAFRWNFTAALGTFDGDGDGMPDQWEIDNGLDPTVDDAQNDADGDGMPNIYEFENDLDPQVNDAELDSDGDGATNLEEYEAGTDPNDPSDTPAAPMDWLPILMAVVVIAVIAVVVLWFLLGRKKKPVQTEPGHPSAYQELRELRPEVPPERPPQEGQPANQGSPAPPSQGDQQSPPPPGQ
ncbi:MAG: DNRLRE domain-containing protein [Methanobacteriota archaeon]